MLTTKNTAAHVAQVFSVHCIALNLVPTYLLTNNGPSFFGKQFVTICTYLEIKQLTTTTYQPLKDSLKERYINSIVTGLRRYVAQYQKSQDISVQLLTRANNKHDRCSTNTAALNIALDRHPLGPKLLSAKQTHYTDLLLNRSIREARWALEARIPT